MTARFSQSHNYAVLMSLFPSSFLSVSLSFLFFPFFVVKGEIFYTNETYVLLVRVVSVKILYLGAPSEQQSVQCDGFSRTAKTYLRHIIFRLRKLHRWNNTNSKSAIQQPKSIYFRYSIFEFQFRFSKKKIYFWYIPR